MARWIPELAVIPPDTLTVEDIIGFVRRAIECIQYKQTDTDSLIFTCSNKANFHIKLEPLKLTILVSTCEVFGETGTIAIASAFSYMGGTVGTKFHVVSCEDAEDASNKVGVLFTRGFNTLPESISVASI